LFYFKGGGNVVIKPEETQSWMCERKVNEMQKFKEKHPDPRIATAPVTP